MKTIIFTNDKKNLARHISGNTFPVIHIVQMKYDQQAEEIVAALETAGHRLEYIKEEKYIQNYEKIYAEFIGTLNVQHQTWAWWAHDLTNKNPITTHLCTCVYYAILLNLLLKNALFDCLVVLSDDRDILRQIQLYAQHNKDVRIIDGMRKNHIGTGLKQLIPAAIVYKFLSALLNKILAGRYLPQPVKQTKPYIFVMSLLYAPSFHNNRYQDVYFGGFVEHLKKKGVPFINFMEVCAPYRDMMQKTVKYAKTDNIYPKEYFLSIRSIVRALGTALRRFFSNDFKPCPLIEDTDVSFIVNRFIRYEYTSTKYMANMMIFYAVADVCKRFRIEKFYYPFENRSFEKMMVQALRRFSPGTKIIGYQHASLSLRHTNFFLGKGEAQVTPLPDVIVTLGEITKNIMRDDGNFPDELLQVGCALRQKVYHGELKPRIKKNKNVFVALATSLEEYIKVLQFLNEALTGCGESYTIWIRPHPVFSLEDALKISGGIDFQFYKADKESLEECYQWADVILYVHSTLAIEGLMRGVPAIHLRVSSPLNPDPLYNFHDFKWQVNKPADLSSIFIQMEGLTDMEFNQRQKAGQSFSLKYIRGTTETRMEEFYHGQV